MNNQWETVKVALAGKARIVTQSREHGHLGKVYSIATAGEGMERPGFVRIQLEMVDGVIRCANGAQLQSALADAIDAAILDMAARVQAGDVPRAWRPKRAQPKAPRKLDLTPEERERRRAKTQENRAIKRDRDQRERLAMKGSGLGGGKKKAA